MNRAARLAPLSVPPPAAASSLGSISFFHSTPALERKRRTHFSNYGRSSHRSKRFNYYARMSRIESKRTLFRNVTDYADYLFQSWKDEDDDLRDFSLNDETPWFRRQYWSKGTKSNGVSSNEYQFGGYNDKKKGGFNFCATDGNDDVETIFRSTFGGEGFHYWSFESSENFHWRRTSRQANRTRNWDWRYETDEEEDSSPQSDLTSERAVLGLKASGPLKLEEVKIAYRACALKWHPDRHQGSSKAVAEEKFKHCTAAYKSLCEKLAAQ